MILKQMIEWMVIDGILEFFSWHLEYYEETGK